MTARIMLKTCLNRLLFCELCVCLYIIQLAAFFLYASLQPGVKK